MARTTARECNSGVGPPSSRSAKPVSVRVADQTLQPNRSSTRALATRPWKRAGRPGPAGDDPAPSSTSGWRKYWPPRRADESTRATEAPRAAAPAAAAIPAGPPPTTTTSTVPVLGGPVSAIPTPSGVSWLTPGGPALPRESEEEISSPSDRGRRHARTACSPFTSTRQSKQVPIPQNRPRRWSPRRVVRHARSPLASSAPATVMPAGAVRCRPSKRNSTTGRG